MTGRTVCEIQMVQHEDRRARIAVRVPDVALRRPIHHAQPVLPDGDSMAVLLDPTGISFGICRLKG
jgi:hypothetical protein